MAFFESVKSAFINCLNFKGRTSKKDFWNYIIFFAIMLLILYFPALKIAKELRHGSYLFISPLLLAIPLLSLTYRRLNDAGETRLWMQMLVFIYFYIFCVFIVMIFHHPDLEFIPTRNVCQHDFEEMSQEWCKENGPYIDGEADPYIIALIPFIFPLMLFAAILGPFALVFIFVPLILFFTLLDAISRQKIEEDEDEAEKDENTAEEEGPAEKDKKLGTAGKVFLFAVAALVIGIPVMEIIRLTSAA